MRKTALPIAMTALLSACATTPRVIYSYYPVKAATTVTLTQTVDCTKDRSQLIFLYTPVVTTTYAADRSSRPVAIAIHDLSGIFSDTDFSLSLYDDGRLKGVNTSTTGQAEAVAKAAITLATAAVGLGGGNPSGGGKPSPLADCSVIANWGGGKPVTLTYSKAIDYSAWSFDKPVKLDPVMTSAAAYNALKTHLPLLQVLVNSPTPNLNGARYDKAVPQGPDAAPHLTLQEIDDAQVDVLSQGSPIYSGLVTLPSKRSYDLPLPRAVWFGKQGLSLSISEAGAITAIDYGKSTGAAGVLNVASGAVTAAQPETTAARAAEWKAQGDIIAQQERVARCSTNRATCQ